MHRLSIETILSTIITVVWSFKPPVEIFFAGNRGRRGTRYSLTDAEGVFEAIEDAISGVRGSCTIFDIAIGYHWRMLDFRA
jgi:hypothetical protein